MTQRSIEQSGGLTQTVAQPFQGCKLDGQKDNLTRPTRLSFAPRGHLTASRQPETRR
jgi:hypothetical protein